MFCNTLTTPDQDKRNIVKNSKKLRACKEKAFIKIFNINKELTTTKIFIIFPPSSLRNKKLDKKPSIFKLINNSIKQTTIKNV